MTDQTVIPREADTPEVKRLQETSLILAANYKDYAVSEPKEYEGGAEHLKQIKAALKQAEAEREKIVRPLIDAKRATDALFQKITAPMVEAEANVKKGLLAYQTEQDRIAREEQRKEEERAERERQRLLEEARKANELAAKKERERLAREKEKADEAARIERARIAEQERIANEKAAEERARIEAEEKDAAEDEAKQRSLQEEKRRIREREEAEQRRIQEEKDAAAKREQEEQERLHQQQLEAEAKEREDTARAQILEERAETTMVAPVASQAPKVKGISTRGVWKFKVTDPAKVPDKYKKIDEAKIGKIVKALKADHDIPGIKAWEEKTMAAGAGR